MEDDLKPMMDGADDRSHVATPQSDHMPVEQDHAVPAVSMTVESVKQQVKDHVGLMSEQAGDKAMMFAEQGKDRAVGALEQLSKMIDDAAGQVDEKLGGSGHYVRSAAGTVQGFADQLRDRKVDDLVGDARTLVRKSPGIAIGAAAVIGFVVARLASAGLDPRED